MVTTLLTWWQRYRCPYWHWKIQTIPEKKRLIFSTVAEFNLWKPFLFNRMKWKNCSLVELDYITTAVEQIYVQINWRKKNNCFIIIEQSRTEINWHKGNFFIGIFFEIESPKWMWNLIRAHSIDDNFHNLQLGHRKGFLTFLKIFIY